MSWAGGAVERGGLDPVDAGVRCGALVGGVLSLAGFAAPARAAVASFASTGGEQTFAEPDTAGCLPPESILPTRAVPRLDDGRVPILPGVRGAKDVDLHLHDARAFREGSPAAAATPERGLDIPPAARRRYHERAEETGQLEDRGSPLRN